MAVVFKNNAKTTLASGINSSATSITVSDGSVFPSLTGSDIFFVTFDDGTNNEIVKVTARSGNTLTVVRAQESTTARSFSTGDEAQLRLTAGILGLFSQTGVAITDEIEAYLDANGLTFPDNVKATFGDSADLEIFHTGNSSIIKDAGTGSLSVRGTHLNLADAGGNIFIEMTDTGTGGTVEIKHNAATKLATTSTGIDVTGRTTTDGLTTSASIISTSNSNSIGGTTFTSAVFGTSLSLSASITASGNSNSFGNSSFGTISSGAITSSGNLTVNSSLVRINNTSGQSDLRFVAANDNFSQILFGDTDGTSRGTIRYKHDTDSFFIAAGGITSSDLEITNSAVNVTSGNLQISGTTIVNSSRNLINIVNGTLMGTLDVSGNVTFFDETADAHHSLTLQKRFNKETAIKWARGSDVDAQIRVGDGENLFIDYNHSNTGDSVIFRNNSSEVARIDNSGNVGISTDSPNRKLHVSGAGSTIAAKIQATDGSQASIDLTNSEGAYRLINDGGQFFIFDDTDSRQPFTINTSGTTILKGGTSGTSDHALIVRNSSNTSLFSIRNDGRIDLGGSQIFDISRNMSNIGTISSGAITSSGNATFSGGFNKFTGDVEIEHNPLILDTNPSNSYGVTEALRIDDSGGTNDRALQIFELLHSGARSHRLTFNTNITTDGSAYTYTQGNYGGSSQIEFGNSGPIVFYTNTQNTGGSTTAITPIERLRIKETGEVQVQGELETGGLLKLDYTNPTLTLRPDNSAHFNIKANESPVRLELGHSVNKNLYLSNTGGATFNYNLNVVSDFKINGTTVIDSSRNLTNIDTGNFGGKVTISDSGFNNHLRIERSGQGDLYLTPSGQQLMLGGGGFCPANTNDVDLGRSDKYWRTLLLGTSLQMDGTTVIDSSRNLTNIGTINSGTITSSGNIDVNSDSGQLQFGADNDMQIFHNGANGEINNATGSFIIDSAGDITLDADGQDILFKDGGTQFGSIRKNGNNLQLMASIQDGDITFHGDDGGSAITALALDMSAGGNATFAGTISSGSITSSGNVAGATMSTTGDIDFGGRTQIRKDLRIRGDGSNSNNGVVRFHTNSNSRLTIDPGNTGSNVFFLDTSGNLTVPGTISGTLASTVTATTQSAGDNSTKVATTAYTDTAIANLVDGAPSTLNTLNEIAAALNDDAALNTTLTNSIAAKLPLAGGTMTGALNMGSQNITNAGTISSGDIISTGLLRSNKTSFPQLQLQDASNSVQIGHSGNNFFIKRGDNDGEIRFRNVDNTDPFIFDLTTATPVFTTTGNISVAGTTVLTGDTRIGSANPAGTHALKVYHTDNFEAAKFETNLGGALARFTDSTNSIEIGNQNGEAVLRTGNSVRLAANSSGNVRVATGDLQMGSTTVIDASRNLTNIASLNIDGDIFGTGNFDIRSTGNIFNTFGNSSKTFFRTQDGTVRFVIDSAGKIGAGGNIDETPDANLHIRTSDLGGTSGDQQEIARFSTNVSNGSSLRVYTERHSTGTDWTSAQTKIQQRIDATDQGYILFNGSGNTYGIEIGTHGTAGQINLRHKGTVRLNTVNAGVNVTGALQVGTTTVIDSSRNLTNIGTVSCGAITTSGNFNQTGGTFLTHGDEVSSLTTAWQAAGTSKNRGLYPFRYQNGATGQPESGNNANWGLNIYAHAGSGGNYPHGTQFAMGSSQNLFFRWFSNGSAQDWKEVVTANTSGNVVLDGGITSTGNLSLTTTGSEIMLDAYNTSQEGGGIFFREGFQSSNKYNLSIIARSRSNDGSADGLSINGYEGVFFSTGSNSYQERFGIDVSGNIAVGGTTILDQSRNLSNIGTITSGYITATGIDARAAAATTTNTTSYFATSVGAAGAGDDWQNSPISIRERGLVGSAQSGGQYSPNINFHWANRVSMSLSMDLNGDFHLGDYNSNGVPNMSTASGLAHLNLRGVKIGNVTVINDSRNLSNIGTISSGAITSSSDVTVNDRLNSSGDNDTYLQFHAADQFRVVTGGSERLEVNTSETKLTTGNLNVISGQYLVNGTAVIDSSRNLTNIGTISSGVITSTGASSGRYTGLEVVNSTNAGGTETAIGLGVVSASNTACDVKLVANRVGANSGSDFYIEQTDSSGSQQETIRISESGNVTFAGEIFLGNNKEINFAKADGTNDGTKIERFGGNALRFRYTGNSCIFDSLGDNEFSIRNSNDAVIFKVDPNATLSSCVTSIQGVFQIAGTTVINASRNLVNIGTISSGAITSSGDITAFSDERLKDNIQTLDGKKALQMRGVSYIRDGKEGSGVIAQEIEKIAPELVLTADDEQGTKSVAYGNLVGYLIEAIKEQQDQIEYMKSEIKVLKEANNGNK